MELPKKTVERLSQYRRLLLKYQYLEKPFIFSRDLARMLNINPVHVRRDMMLLGFSGSHARGYDVKKLVKEVSMKLECHILKNACIVGFGHLGRAVLDMFAGGGTPVNIAALFDTSPKAINQTFEGIKCYSMDKMEQVIADNHIKLAILTSPADDVEKVKDLLVACGITGIMNMTSQPLDLPEGVHLEEFDLKTLLIKLSYFSKA
jgi:redox-sensing transcriptional repressor